jgi:hypothetical protein
MATGLTFSCERIACRSFSKECSYPRILRTPTPGTRRCFSVVLSYLLRIVLLQPSLRLLGSGTACMPGPLLPLRHCAQRTYSMLFVQFALRAIPKVPVNPVVLQCQSPSP